MTGSGATATFKINADGVGNDAVSAFTVTGFGLTGQTVQHLLDVGILVANHAV